MAGGDVVCAVIRNARVREVMLWASGTSNAVVCE